MNTILFSKNILQVLEKGWNTANGALFAEPFADISEFVDTRSILHQHASRTFIAESHEALFRGIYAGSTISYQHVQSAQLDQYVILLHAAAELDAPSGPLKGIHHSMMTIVLQLVEDQWKIRSFHNSLVQKPF